jgi:integrase
MCGDPAFTRRRSLLGLDHAPADAPRPFVRNGNKRSILEVLGPVRIDVIGPTHVTRLHLAWKETPTRANRALALLSHMFTMAERWNLRPAASNPCRHVERFRESRRERFLSPAELARLGETLTTLEATGGASLYGLAAVRLLVFTGARASEMLTMTWDSVNLEAGTVRLADSKTGAKTVFLNPPSVDVLARLPRIGDNPYVIAGGNPGAALTLSGLEQVWQSVREVAGLADVRLHDLRHSFASVAAARGQSLTVIGALLGHTQATTTQRYAHLSADPLRAASDAVAAEIANAMRGRAAER